MTTLLENLANTHPPVHHWDRPQGKLVERLIELRGRAAREGLSVDEQTELGVCIARMKGIEYASN